jgi:hypothetical protein
MSRSTRSTFERGFDSEADRTGFSSHEDLLSPTPSERVSVSLWVTFGQLKKKDPQTPKFQICLVRLFLGGKLC